MAAPFNARLSDLLHKAQGAALNARSAEDVKAALAGSGSLSDYFDRYLSTLDDRGAYWEGKKYRCLRTKLEHVFGRPLAWGPLDRTGLTRFERFLRDPPPRGCSNQANTIRSELKRLRRLARRAIRDGALRVDADPFLAYDPPKSQPVSRRRLSAREVEGLSALELDVDSRLRVVRDLFLIAYYAAGVRVSDMLTMKLENVVREGTIARLVYRMQKTGTPMAPKLPSIALDVLGTYLEAARRGSYLFPLMQPGDDTDPVDLRRRQARATAKANEALKRLAVQAGINPAGLSTHVARHSWADAARQVGNLYAVSKGLGHKGLKTTEAYLAEMDMAAVDAITDSLWNG